MKRAVGLINDAVSQESLRNAEKRLRMKKRPGLCLCVMVLAFGLCGCQLAREELQEEAKADRLAGMYITQEHLDLFDSDRYFSDHMDQLLSGKNTAVSEAERRNYENRVYAVYQEKEAGAGDYVFEGLDGICFLAVQSPFMGEMAYAAQSDPEVTDVRMSVTDAGFEMEGTIYCPTDDNARFYFNPVYQTAGGEVYLLAGTGISGSLTDGASMSQRLEESSTKAVNGKEISEKNAFSITVCGQDSYDGYEIAQMDGQDRKLRETAYPAQELPDSVAVSADTAYLICTLRQKGSDGSVKLSRKLVELSEDENYLELFVPGEKGLSIRKQILVERKNHF